MAKDTSKLERIIAESSNPVTVDAAKKILADDQSRLADIGSAQIQVASQAGTLDPQMLAVLDAIKVAMKPSAGGSVDVSQVRDLITAELRKRKINEDDLSQSLKAWLNATRKVSLTVDRLMNFSLVAGTGSQQVADILKRPLMQLILSDLVARNNVYLYGGAGTGKAQPLTAKILCEKGWKTFAEIQVGDKVFGEDGKLYEVNGVYDRGVKPVYRCYMNDGAYTDTCDEHLWNVTTRSERGKGKSGKVKQLSEFMDKIKTKQGYANAFIPVPKSISFPEKNHIIHPYTLGVLIGDGSMTVSNSISITNPCEEIFENLILPVENKLSKQSYSKRCLTYRIIKAENSSENVVVSELKKVGLSGKKSVDKFIPKEYLFDSFENRVELLQGLNDTDGYCLGTDFEYSTSSIQLATDYCELVRSLGGTAKAYKRITFYNHNGEKKAGVESYRIRCVFPSNVMPFKLSEKKNKFKHHSKYQVKRYFDSVEYVGEMPVKCISVTNPTHLYITDNYVVTHNTFIAEQVADLLGWRAIVLNCNQFTSPLDILGGQTIEGYQEGKLSMAWSNIIQKPDGSKEEVSGCVLILDELPKIDPNTAGILNQALAKVKDFKEDFKTGTVKAPTILNGRNEVLSLKNLFIIATGNVALNTIDPDYEANFKQDLSLQDRFIGSTYKVFVDYREEFDNTMRGFAFIWIFMTKVREEIVKLKATGQAFVSLRVMINMKATYFAYRSLKMLNKVGVGNLADNAIAKPKTLKDSLETFFALFKPNIKQAIINAVDLDGFLRIVAEKDKMKFDPDMPNFNTQKEIDEANEMIRRHEEEIKNQSI